MDSELMTTEEVITYLKISRATLIRLRREGKLPTYKIGGQRVTRFKRKDVEALLKRQGSDHE